MSYTIIIVIITSIISFLAFNNQDIFNKLIFYPFIMSNRSEEYYRFITSGFIHANLSHLLFNMITLYFFGVEVEAICREVGMPSMYLLLYLSAIVISSIPAFTKHQTHSYYRSLGASGGVSAILFATVYFEPWNKIYIYFIPIGIPSILFAVLYLFYSAYMSKKGNDHIGHDAHLWGSVYGFVFAFFLDLKLTHGQAFINQLLHPVF